MFGIPILGHADVFCDNGAVYNITAFYESTIRKKHNSIWFHHVRECVAASILIFHKAHTKWNLADILTKSLYAEYQVMLISMIIIDDV